MNGELVPLGARTVEAPQSLHGNLGTVSHSELGHARYLPLYYLLIILHCVS
jgi:hypothetical protein